MGLLRICSIEENEVKTKLKSQMEELVEKQRILGVLAMKKRLEKRSSKVSDKRLIEMSKDNFNVGGGQGLGNYILNSGSNIESHDQSITNHQKQTKPLLENE